MCKLCFFDQAYTESQNSSWLNLGSVLACCEVQEENMFEFQFLKTFFGNVPNLTEIRSQYPFLI